MHCFFSCKVPKGSIFLVVSGCFFCVFFGIEKKMSLLDVLEHVLLPFTSSRRTFSVRENCSFLTQKNQSKQSCVFVVISDTNEQEKICMASTSRFCSSGKKKVQSSPLCIFITVHNMYSACTRARVCGLRTYCVQFKTRAEARV